MITPRYFNPFSFRIGKSANERKPGHRAGCHACRSGQTCLTKYEHVCSKQQTWHPETWHPMAWLLGVLLLVTAIPVSAQTRPETITASEPATAPAVHFTTVSIFVDSQAKPLAAYQIEFLADGGDVQIVGVEGGEHAAYRAAPYYDPAALMNRRIIVAAFSTGPDLPMGKTRVARLHLRIAGPVAPHYLVKLVVAAGADGKPVPATVTLTEGEGK